MKWMKPAALLALFACGSCTPDDEAAIKALCARADTTRSSPKCKCLVDGIRETAGEHYRAALYVLADVDTDKWQPEFDRMPMRRQLDVSERVFACIVEEI